MFWFAISWDHITPIMHMYTLIRLLCNSSVCFYLQLGCTISGMTFLYISINQIKSHPLGLNVESQNSAYVSLPSVELVVWSTLGPVLGFREAPLPRSQSPWSTPPPRLLQLHKLLSKSQCPGGGQWASVNWTSSNAMSPSWVRPAFTPSTTIWNTKR